jgi:hypothetical protein
VVSPTDAAVRDAARDLAPELTAVLGASGAAVSLATAARIEWSRMAASADVLRTAARLLLGLGYLLAHRTTMDLASSQGETTAPIGAGATGGAVVGTSVGGMSIQYGTAGGFSPMALRSAMEADLSASAYGRAYLAMLAVSPGATAPLHR